MNTSATAMFALWLAVAASSASSARADERILHYRADLSVGADGRLDVVEHIRVRAEGSQIRRGIYRDFPTQYDDRFGNSVVVALNVLGAERNGVSEPWSTAQVANGLRIKIGSGALLSVPAEYEYTLRYQTTRQLGFFADHDELYWNAIGTGWAFSIDEGSADVQLPAAVPVAEMGVEAYTGRQGGLGRDYQAALNAPGHAHFALTRALAPREGMTIVVTFPKGVVHEPTGVQRSWWFLHDNVGVLVALLGWFALLAFCIAEWRHVGRDPDKGTLIARYEPPPGHSPASLRYVWKMRYDTRCFSSDLLSLAVTGCLRIEHDKSPFGELWQLERAAPAQPPALAASQRALLDRLFVGGNEVVLKKDTASTVPAARSAHEGALAAEARPRYFRLNTNSVLRGVLIAVLSAIVAAIVAHGSGGLAIALVIVLMILTLFVFARLVRAPTSEGRALLDAIEGLKLYLSVAERDELARMRGPDAPVALDTARYERLLPFAVALEVEDAWSTKFASAVGAAAAATAAAGIAWYHGASTADLGSLSHAVGDSLSSHIASAATPPGSSSGVSGGSGGSSAGGGGSSGGGGGGGGGGGW